MNEKDLRFYYDFSEKFKNAGVCEVVPLYWYADGSYPKAIVTIVSSEAPNPRVGEILKVGLGREFWSEVQRDA